MLIQDLKPLLEEKYQKFNRPEFIEDDPVCIPHLFSAPRDIEIAGFLAATLAWGQRKTIISKCRELLKMMDHAPHDFVANHSEKELVPFVKFKHRTFNGVDTLYFIHFLRHLYQKYETMEMAFTESLNPTDVSTERGLNGFRKLFVSLPDFPSRCGKHVASPDKKSACKRLNMFLRWMVRKDDNGVDFGIWRNIKPAQLVCPCDVHVEKVARKMALIRRKQADWLTAIELTENLKKFDPDDPVKYDFALFGLGLEEKYKETFSLSGN